MSTDPPVDSGFVVSDADGVPFWTEFRALGGPAQLGYPLSARYAEGPHRYQLLQTGVLRWNADARHADLHAVFVALSELGLDDWLAARGVPRPAPDLARDPVPTAEARLAWLTHPLLRDAYRGADAALALRRFGLPMGEPERLGPYLAQRFERAVLQLWQESVPGQPAPGSVTLVQTGALMQDAGLVPPPALEPAPAPAPPPAPEPPPAEALGVAGEHPRVTQGKYVAVSVGRQWWWAYEDGRLLYDSPVTTGRPELYTPIGRYTVLNRHSPYTFVSPWPPGSPFWYETATSRYALRITGNGIFLHDAPWRPVYGPGTNVPHRTADGVWRTGSHGCINMPFAAAQWLWGFAPLGVPVDVIG